jgi:hypothetical protein
MLMCMISQMLRELRINSPPLQTSIYLTFSLRQWLPQSHHFINRLRFALNVDGFMIPTLENYYFQTTASDAFVRCTVVDAGKSRRCDKDCRMNRIQLQYSNKERPPKLVGKTNTYHLQQFVLLLYSRSDCGMQRTCDYSAVQPMEC